MVYKPVFFADSGNYFIRRGKRAQFFIELLIPVKAVGYIIVHTKPRVGRKNDPVIEIKNVDVVAIRQAKTCVIIFYRNGPLEVGAEDYLVYAFVGVTYPYLSFAVLLNIAGWLPKIGYLMVKSPIAGVVFAIYNQSRVSTLYQLAGIQFF